MKKANKPDVILISQRQLEEFVAANKIGWVKIHGLSKRKWYPVFEVEEGGKTYEYTIRVLARQEVRYWADLRLLVHWLRFECGVVETQLILSDLDWD